MFRMTVEDVFVFERRGLAVTGTIESGTVRVGDELHLDGIRTTRVKEIEMFRKLLDWAEQGDSVGLFLDGVEKEDVPHGTVLSGAK
jgi:elongation factor Tu